MLSISHCQSCLSQSAGLLQSAWIWFPFEHQHMFPRWDAAMRWRRMLQSPIGLLHLTNTTRSGTTGERKSYTSFTFPLYPCLAAREAVSKCFEPTHCGQPVMYFSQALQHFITRLTVKAQCGWRELGQLLCLGSTRVSGGLSPLDSLVLFRH